MNSRHSWLSPKTEIRPSSIHGLGLFARAEIERNEVVAVKGGHVLTGAEWKALQPLLSGAEIQIDDNLFLAPVTESEREGSMLYLNHSCESNLGVSGNVTFVAMRPIAPGEELTHDWCMTDDDDSETPCRCQSIHCRNILTGKDWQEPALQRRYTGYFSAYLAKKIAVH